METQSHGEGFKEQEHLRNERDILVEKNFGLIDKCARIFAKPEVPLCDFSSLQSIGKERLIKAAEKWLESPETHSSTFEAYATIALANAFRDALRKESPKTTISFDAVKAGGVEGADDESDVGTVLNTTRDTRMEVDPEREFLAQYDQEKLYEAIDRLPDQDRIIFLMVLEDMSYLEIGLRLQTSEGAVKNRVYRAKPLLRQYLEENNFSV